MAAAFSSLLATVASSSYTAISTRRPRAASAAAASLSSSSRSSCPLFCASPARALRSCVVANAAPAMQLSPASRVSTVVDLGDQSYPIYIGFGLLDNPDLVKRHVHRKRVLVVTSMTVTLLYLEKVTWALTHDNPTHSPQSLKQRTS